MLGIRHVAIPTLVALAIGAGCTINENTSPNGGNDGTTQIQPSKAHALVTGHVEGSMQGDIRFNVNKSSRDVVVAPDQSFVVRDVPTGEVSLECGAGDIKGTLTITDVQPGEMIEVTIRREGDAIVIVIVARTKPTEPPREVETQSGDALEISASNVCYWFKPGHYKRDVIVTGNNVHLFGAAHESCVVDDLTFLDGKLEIRGKDVSVFDVEIAGDLTIAGKNARIQDTCTRCFNDGCKHACGKEDHQCGKGNDDHGNGGHNEHDAGAPPPPPTTTDAGAAVDSGATNADGGTTNADSGVTTTDASSGTSSDSGMNGGG